MNKTQKNRGFRRNSHNNDHDRSITLPDVVNMDDLAVLTDEELYARSRLLDEDRQYMFNAGAVSRPWEEELAYVKRELMLRKSRRDAHEAYVRQIEREFQEQERNLPMADMDNTQFLRAVGEIN